MSRRRAAGNRTPSGSVHAQVAVPQHVPPPVPQNENLELFVDLMMGAPLQIFVEKDVPDRDEIVRLIEKHGGVVASAYSTVPYILVDPTKESGQNLFRQYSAKRGKIVLNAAWVHACVTAGQLQTFKTNYAGFKVDGTERDRPDQPPPPPPPPAQAPEQRTPARPRTSSRRRNDPPPTPAFAQPAQPLPYPPQQQWPEHPHYAHTTPQQPYYSGAPPPSQWATNQAQYSALGVPIIEGGAYPPYSAYPGDDQAWGAGGEDADQYYDQTFPQVPYGYDIPPAGPSVQPAQPEDTSQSPEPIDPDENDEESQRGRKRTRSGRVRNALSEKVDPQKLVSARGPPTRSPDPPARVIKSTHGGNLFTSDDVEYLKAYIEYCQNQGLVLSLREICERLAVKAPHHTFYSWRRYCNKHQIRLGAYTMDDPSSADAPEPATTTHQLAAPSSKAETNPSSSSSTQPHHQDTQQPLPEGPPQKRKRYDHEDDMLLARYFATSPQGTSDAIFQRFARMHPHHPWKGWQEHHRIHKTQIDHLMKGIIQNGSVQTGSSSASVAGGGGAGSSAAGSSAGGISMGIGVAGISVVGVVGVDDGLQNFGLEPMEA
ncbi:hypothetical protein FRC06_002239 [Ceratobasidium sp. 370]|nr:hypothetical protein FRC06_002239 [Ceratobasidium sp. 370]